MKINTLYLPSVQDLVILENLKNVEEIGTIMITAEDEDDNSNELDELLTSYIDTDMVRQLQEETDAEIMQYIQQIKKDKENTKKDANTDKNLQERK